MHTIYQIGGLGADLRVFQYLNLIVPVISVKWIEPIGNESIEKYALRITDQIDTTKDFGILGVSFGGLIAIELSKLLNPKYLILISSAVTSDQLPKKYILLGKTGILKLIPNILIKPPKFLRSYLFGAKNKDLLNQIIEDTDPSFIKWALNQLIKWESNFEPNKVLRIHGSNDKLIPLKGKAIVVPKGEHFMIVDEAKLISEIINKKLNNTG